MDQMGRVTSDTSTALASTDQIQHGKPKVPGAEFVARDQILPFDKLTFGLIDQYDRGVRIFSVEFQRRKVREPQ